MMPDKIFLIRNKQKNKILRSWGESSVSHDGYEFIEYIHKDVLLKKLNRAIELRIKSGANETSDGVMTLNAIIRYIESL